MKLMLAKNHIISKQIILMNYLSIVRMFRWKIAQVLKEEGRLKIVTKAGYCGLMKSEQV